MQERAAEAWWLLRDEARRLAPVRPPGPSTAVVLEGRLVYGLVASVVAGLVLGWMVGAGDSVVAGLAGALLGHGLFIFTSAFTTETGCVLDDDAVSGGGGV